MRLEEILERNRAFTGGRQAHPLTAAERIDLAVVACYDPRLDDLLLPAFGLKPGEAFLLRTAGALMQPASSSLRSLGLAVFMFGVKEIVVVGHKSCRMAAFDSAGFIDAFRRRGVAREAFGPDDLRAWAGAIPDPRTGVKMSVSNITAAPFMPKDLTVSGLLLDEASGALEVVVKPGEAAALPSSPPLPAGAPGFPETAPQPPATPIDAAPPQADARAGAPQAAPAVPGVPPAMKDDPLATAIAEFVWTLESEAGMGRELRQVRADMDRQSNPLVKFGLLEGFVRKAAAQSGKVADAYAKLRHEVAASRRRWDPQEVIHYFQMLVRRS